MSKAILFALIGAVGVIAGCRHHDHCDVRTPQRYIVRKVRTQCPPPRIIERHVVHVPRGRAWATHRADRYCD
jgi:hypothetical protein